MTSPLVGRLKAVGGTELHQAAEATTLSHPYQGGARALMHSNKSAGNTLSPRCNAQATCVISFATAHPHFQIRRAEHSKMLYKPADYSHTKGSDTVLAATKHSAACSRQNILTCSLLKATI